MYALDNMPIGSHEAQQSSSTDKELSKEKRRKVKDAYKHAYDIQIQMINDSKSFRKLKEMLKTEVVTRK